MFALFSYIHAFIINLVVILLNIIAILDYTMQSLYNPFLGSMGLNLSELCTKGVHDNSSKDTSSNTTFGRIRQLVECNVWSKSTVGRILFLSKCV